MDCNVFMLEDEHSSSMDQLSLMIVPIKKAHSPSKGRIVFSIFLLHICNHARHLVLVVVVECENLDLIV